MKPKSAIPIETDRTSLSTQPPNAIPSRPPWHRKYPSCASMNSMWSILPMRLYCHSCFRFCSRGVRWWWRRLIVLSYFMPFIGLLQQHCMVQDMEAELDYRTRTMPGPFFFVNASTLRLTGSGSTSSLGKTCGSSPLWWVYYCDKIRLSRQHRYGQAYWNLKKFLDCYLLISET